MKRRVEKSNLMKVRSTIVFYGSRRDYGKSRPLHLNGIKPYRFQRSSAPARVWHLRGDPVDVAYHFIAGADQDDDRMHGDASIYSGYGLCLRLGAALQDQPILFKYCSQDLLTWMMLTQNLPTDSLALDKASMVASVSEGPEREEDSFALPFALRDSCWFLKKVSNQYKVAIAS